MWAKGVQWKETLLKFFFYHTILFFWNHIYLQAVCTTFPYWKYARAIWSYLVFRKLHQQSPQWRRGEPSQPLIPEWDAVCLVVHVMALSFCGRSLPGDPLQSSDSQPIYYSNSFLQDVSAEQRQSIREHSPGWGRTEVGWHAELKGGDPNMNNPNSPATLSSSNGIPDFYHSCMFCRIQHRTKTLNPSFTNDGEFSDGSMEASKQTCDPCKHRALN